MSQLDCSEQITKMLALVNLIQCAIVLPIVSLLIYKFIKYYKKPQNHGRLMVAAVVVFFISIWCDILTILIGDILCYFDKNVSSAPIRINVFTILAYTQVYCLLYIFFIRFHHVLKPTKFKFSSFTLKTYYTLFIIIGICALTVFISSIFTSIIRNHFLYILAATTMLFMVFLIISLILLFIMKLMKIHRNKFDEGVISVITRS